MAGYTSVCHEKEQDLPQEVLASNYSPVWGAKNSYDQRMKAREKNKNKNKN